MTLVWLSIITFAANLIGTIVGFGISTIMIPILVFFYPFTQVLLLVGILHWFSNIWKLALFKHGIDWKLIIAFAIPGMIATTFGALLSVHEPQEFLARTLGIFLMTYVIFLLIHPTFKMKKHIGYAVVGGSISGFLAGIFGFRGAIRSSFLSAFNLPKEVFIATGAAIALAIDTVRLSVYLTKGSTLTVIPLWALGLLILISWVGAFAARYVVRIIPQANFRPVVVFFLLVMSVKLIFFP
ncbi:MAG TPA: sulfite exporter TauE/SafE family protein [Candidatus Babeliales bacterium]|nr:sulfite exporter TauE/SafE family protein [Candidatus Babeliales bacterium]